MIRVVINLPELTLEAREAYIEWTTKAAKLTGGMIDRWEAEYPIAPEKLIQESVWTTYKKWLYAHVFHQKCAFCEKLIDDEQVDMEHFRPKRAVHAEIGPDKWAPAKTRMPDGEEIDHPGYFWLAYDSDNLMPACQSCNSSSATGQTAKKEKFPAKRHCVLVRLNDTQASGMDPKPWPSKRWKGYYYLRPKELDRFEERLLVQPMIDTPREHLRFLKGGSVTAFKGSLSGEKTVEVLVLNRDALVKKRKEEQERAWSKVAAVWGDDSDEDTLFDRCEPKLQNFLAGKSEYSAAILDFLDEKSLPAQFKDKLRAARRF